MDQSVDPSKNRENKILPVLIYFLGLGAILAISGALVFSQDRVPDREQASQEEPEKERKFIFECWFKANIENGSAPYFWISTNQAEMVRKDPTAPIYEKEQNEIKYEDQVFSYRASVRADLNEKTPFAFFDFEFTDKRTKLRSFSSGQAPNFNFESGPFGFVSVSHSFGMTVPEIEATLSRPGPKGPEQEKVKIKSVELSCDIDEAEDPDAEKKDDPKKENAGPHKLRLKTYWP